MYSHILYSRGSHLTVFALVIRSLHDPSAMCAASSTSIVLAAIYLLILLIAVLQFGRTFRVITPSVFHYSRVMFFVLISFWTFVAALEIRSLGEAEIRC